MKYLSLIWAQLFRSKTRTLLTLLSVVDRFLRMLDSLGLMFISSLGEGHAPRDRGDYERQHGAGDHCSPQHRIVHGTLPL